MNKILKKIEFSSLVTGFVVEAPKVARSHRAGHFVIVRTGEKANVYRLQSPIATKRQALY